MKITQEYENNLMLILGSLEALSAHIDKMGLPSACPVKKAVTEAYRASTADFAVLTGELGSLHLLNTDP